MKEEKKTSNAYGIIVCEGDAALSAMRFLWTGSREPSEIVASGGVVGKNKCPRSACP